MMAPAAAIAIEDETLHLRRWATSALVVVAMHAALVAGYLFLLPNGTSHGATSPPLLIDLAAEAAAPETPVELATGPQVAAASLPEPEKEVEKVEPPIVAVPPAPAPDPDIPVQKEIVEKPEPPKPLPKPQVKSASLPTSNPRLAKRAQRAEAPLPTSAGVQKATADYSRLINAHLQRFKRSPAGGGAGTAVVTFSIDRAGKVQSRNLQRSSGASNLDAEALAMIARAEPMPPFPPTLSQSNLSFSVPVRFF